MKEGKRIENPGLIGANCKFAPAALNIFSANPEEPGANDKILLEGSGGGTAEKILYDSRGNHFMNYSQRYLDSLTFTGKT